MNESTTFILGVGIALAVSVAVVVYLHAHLRSILRDLCGTQERGDFWAALSNVTLVLVPLICALNHRPPETAVPLFLEVGGQIKWALIGLVAAVALLGFILSWFVLGFAISGSSVRPSGDGPLSR